MSWTAEQRERYARQLVLPQIGASGQRRLRAARVAIVGMGGLGNPAALYLTAAGIGQLTLIDPDPVERSNLQRQILFRDGDVGQSKVQIAAQALQQLNPDTRIDVQQERLEAKTAEGLLSGHHLAIDACDNFATRAWINQACGQLGMPWIHGAAEALAGQMAVFWPNRQPGQHACYQCLYPATGEDSSGGCISRGVLGMVPGLIGQLQAIETVKLITGFAPPLLDTLVSYDASSGRMRHSGISADPECSCRRYPQVAGALPLAAG
ncbi:MAG: hypothetical protein Tsb002_00220 [Wenzhouxiangellaceae bacterium]